CSTGAFRVCDGSGCAATPPSRVKITCPTFIFSPSFTFTSLTTPVTDDGTSTTALSVSSSMTGWPSETFVPGATIKRTRSPCEMFSPSSGSLNSLGPDAGAKAAAEEAATGSAGAPSVGAAAAGAAGGFDGTGAAAAWVTGGAEAFAAAPSTVKITWPTLILSPS